MSLNAVTTPARGDPLREDILIPSEGGECHAWWYPPKSGKRGPAIVIGHGLGGIKEMGLNRYAELFQRAGYGALAFDYVGFGQSTGKSRQILDYWKQQADWDHVLAYVKSMPLVDAYQIGIFGTSFGGAHVIDVAARDPDVVVAISQCPFTSGFASTLTTGFAVPFLGVLGIADTLFGWYKRVNVTVAGKPGQVALMNSHDAYSGYRSLLPAGVEGDNSVAASIALQIPLLFPGASAKKVKIPIHFSICGRDSVAPAGPTLKYARQAAKGEIEYYEDFGHFSIYQGKQFDVVTAKQLDFLRRKLPVEA